MALIKCPECNKEISDKARQCIHCGFPLEETVVELFDVIYKGYKDEKTKFANQTNLIGCLRQLNNIDLSTAKKAIDNPPYTIKSGLSKDNVSWILSTLQPYKCELDVVKSSTSAQIVDNIKIDTYRSTGASTLICPHCGSNQITTGQKGFSLFTGFFGSNKTVNRCGKCGWTWQP